MKLFFSLLKGRPAHWAKVLGLAFALAAVLSIPAVSQEADVPEDDTSRALALFNEGQDAHEKGEIPKAIALYKEALEALAEFPEAEYQLGTAFVSQRDLAGAEAAFRRALKYREDWSLALAALGHTLVRQRNFDEAAKVLVAAVAKDDTNFPALASLVELRLKQGSDTVVLRELLETVTSLTAKANPTASLWAARGALERTLGDHKQAATSLEKAAAADPTSEFVHYELAANALDANDPNAAESYIARFGELDPDSADHKFLRARLLTARNDLHGALTTLNSIKSPLPAAVELRGRLEVELATDPADIEAKLLADRSNVELLGRLCVLYRRRDPGKALEYCRQAHEASGEDAHAIGFAAALVQARQFEQAVTLLRKIAGHIPDNSTVRANLVTALFQLKRYQEAKAELRWLLDRDPDLVNAYYFLAIAHDNLGEYLDAMANYQEFKRRADPEKNADEIGRVDLRLPVLQRQIKSGKGRK